jgi:hypothetical protein
MEWFELSALERRRGAARLAELAALLGAENAQRATALAGPYLLADELAKQLRLEGLELPANGELRALSAEHWESRVAALPEGAEVCGLDLSPEQKRVFRAATKGRPIESPAEALKIAEHLFYGESLKVAVRYTGPRFNQI